MFEDPKFWLAISFLIFISLLGKYVLPIIIKIIDYKTKKIADDVASAKEMKERAEKLLLEAQKQQSEAIIYSRQLIEDAKNEAVDFIINSKKMIEKELEIKMALAEQRIRQEEENVINEIKTRIIDSAIRSIRDNLIRTNDNRKPGEKNPLELAMNKAIVHVSKLIH